MTEAGAHLTLVRPGLEQAALLDDLASVVNAGARHVVDSAGVGAACLGRAGQTLLQQEGGTQQQQLGHLGLEINNPLSRGTFHSTIFGPQSREKSQPAEDLFDIKTFIASAGSWLVLAENSD